MCCRISTISTTTSWRTSCIQCIIIRAAGTYFRDVGTGPHPIFLSEPFNPIPHYLIEHLHFMKNQALCSWFGRPISNSSTRKTYLFIHPKVQIYYSQFPSIFFRSCQIQCFLHTADAIPKSWNTWIAIWRKNMTQMIQPFGNSINSAKKNTGFDNSCKK